MELNVYVFVTTVKNSSKGYWFKLPIDVAKIRQTLLSRGVLTQENYEVDLKISNYEAPFKIDEYEPIEKLNALVDLFKDVDMTLKTFSALVHAGIIDPLNLNVDYLHSLVIIKAEDDEDLGYQAIEKMGGISALLTEQLLQYFDYEGFARDLINHRDYINIGGGNYVSGIN
ncbi:hypothetical protein WOSG25_050460 [Weissella oryzae SG25]|uniref:Antirestriction protein ArdA n=1 Tax=Weissella oryzae (strain DSM 25784 / JCM 18191 / LMG 30913 / SG25) TaxID=1329250 RepID=A0A069CTK3_WEIOS|nr:antirestriction protein ArdA [Weissella oryzae]GAK30774.1 hypothetical protein WOSG25_050460 [Weissella oryzae SG25]